MRGRIWVASVLALVGVGITAGIVSGALKTKSASVTIAPGTDGSATANCAKGSRAVSGGFNAPGHEVQPPEDGNQITVKISARGGKRQWTTEARNYPGLAGELTTYAYCSDSLPKLKAKSKTVTIGPNSTGGTRARCPKGGEAVSGGFVAAEPEDRLFPFMSRRNGERTWTVKVLNDDDAEAFELTTIAYCAPKPLGLKRSVDEEFVDTDGEIVTTKARCKKGQKPVSGGFAGISSGDSNFITTPIESKRAGRRAWRATAAGFAFNPDSGFRWEGYAYCLDKDAL